MKILFIQTGGTIDKDYPKLRKGYAFEIGEPAVKRILAKAVPNFKFKILSIFQKDSLDITDRDREKIYGVCKNTRHDKIIITHGTDTMIETARELNGIKNKTIIITGAMRPEKFSDSDASFNIGVAVGALNILNDGVYLVMNGRVYPWNKVKRDATNGKFIEK